MSNVEWAAYSALKFLKRSISSRSDLLRRFKLHSLAPRASIFLNLIGVSLLVPSCSLTGCFIMFYLFANEICCWLDYLWIVLRWNWFFSVEKKTVIWRTFECCWNDLLLLPAVPCRKKKIFIHLLFSFTLTAAWDRTELTGECEAYRRRGTFRVESFGDPLSMGFVVAEVYWKCGQFSAFDSIDTGQDVLFRSLAHSINVWASSISTVQGLFADWVAKLSRLIFGSQWNQMLHRTIVGCDWIFFPGNPFRLVREPISVMYPSHKLSLIDHINPIGRFVNPSKNFATFHLKIKTFPSNSRKGFVGS